MNRDFNTDVGLIRPENFTKRQMEFLKENCNYSMADTIFLSFDIDWVPDYMLEMLGNLVDGVDASFMHTHSSKACAQISATFPSGIHPNLLRNSDQGQNILEVIDFHKNLGIDFDTCRFHVLNYGYPDLIELSKAGTKLDSSTILFNGKNIIPTYHEDLDMIMAPYFWEDGTFLRSKKDFGEDIIDWKTKGLKIFDFHPLDIYLNTVTLEQRNEFKKSVTKLQETEEKFASKFINNSDFGSRDILKHLLRRRSEGSLKIKSLKTLNSDFRSCML